jgi:hypothetical protein
LQTHRSMFEGTDMKFDIAHEYPIPTETQAFNEKGEPINIRFISGCKEIDKAKQIEKGYPEKRKPTALGKSNAYFPRRDAFCP